MGIDQQVNQQAGAFRQNPAALMQKYQDQKQLIDLLALQKIKTEKEQAAREMQMQMQTQPQTIAQQREQEVMGLARNEIANGIGQVYKRQEAQRQQNLARMASQGIAGVPRQPVKRMASGGIVAFAGGSADPRHMTVEEWKEKIRMARKQAPNISNSDIQKLLDGNPEGMQAFREMLSAESNPYRGSFITQAIEGAERDPSKSRSIVTRRPQPEDSINPFGYEAVPGSGKRSGRSKLGTTWQSSESQSTGGRSGAVRPPESELPQAPAGPGAGVGPLRSLGNDQNPAIAAYEDTIAADYSAAPDVPAGGINNPDAVAAAAAGPAVGALPGEKFRTMLQDAVTERLGRDTEAMRTAASDRYADMTAGSRGIVDVLAGYRGDMSNALAAQQDPERLRRDRLKATLLGMGSKPYSSTAGALGGGLAASMNEQARQDKDKRAGIAALATMAGTEYDKLSPLETGAYAAGETAYNTAEKSKDQALATGGSMANSELIATMQGEANRLRERTNMLIANNADRRQLWQQMNNAAKQIESIKGRISELVQNDPSFMPLENERRKLLEDGRGPGDPKYDAVVNNLNALQDRYFQQFESILRTNEQTVSALQKHLNVDVESMGGDVNTPSAGFGQAQIVNQ